MESLGTNGTVASLHLHSEVPNELMKEVKSISVVVGKGIKDNPRYYDAKTKKGLPNKRHMSLIEREQIEEHALFLSEPLKSGVVRSNIETSGINLSSLLGKKVAIGDNAVVLFTMLRDPCYKMDMICHGLKRLMADGRQGVICEILVSGTINVGDKIRAVPDN